MRNFEEAWGYSSTIPGWYTKAEGELLWNCAKGKGMACEVGSYRGRSTSLLASVVPVIAIEPFILAPGSPNDTPESEGRYVSDALRTNIFEDFVKNMRKFAHFDVRLLPWKTEDCCGSVPTVGVLHIDGDHVDGVFTDIELLTPSLESGGIAVFHDYEPVHTKFSRVKEAVDALGWKVIGKADSAIAVRKP